MNHLAYVLANNKEVLRYLKTRFPVYHLSNIFFRDIHYGIMEYLRERKMAVRYPDGERIARALIERLEHEKILRQLDHQTWMVQYADFRTPQAKSAAPAPGAKAPAPAARPVVPAPANNVPASATAGNNPATGAAVSAAGVRISGSATAPKG